MDPGEDWPPLDDPVLLERLRAPDSELPKLMAGFLDRLHAAGVSFTGLPTDQALSLAAAYPFARADRPVIVDGTEIVADGDLPIKGERRYPLLAYGANASPGRLAEKLAGVTRTDYRLIPALLHDHDICALPVPTGTDLSPPESPRVPGLWSRSRCLS